jgi:hypothetical protein
MKCTIFWDITPFSPLKINRRFCLPHAFTLVSFSAFFDPEDGGDMLPRNVG